VSTSKLIAQASGNRSILVFTNTVPATYKFLVKTVTAPLLLGERKIPYLFTSAYLVTSIFLGYFIEQLWIFVFGFGLSFLLSWFITIALGAIIDICCGTFKAQKYKDKSLYFIIVLLSIFCGGGIGYSLKVGFFVNNYFSLLIIGSGILLAFTLFNPHLQHKRKIKSYRNQEEHLIKRVFEKF